METRKSKLGADHPDTLTSMANLASTYREPGPVGRGRDALEVQVMETSQEQARGGPSFYAELAWPTSRRRTGTRAGGPRPRRSSCR